MNDALIEALVLIVAAGGALLLRRSWRSAAHKRPWLLGGWIVLLLTLLMPAWILGAMRGPFIAVTLASVAALGVVAANVSVKTARSRNNINSLAPEPLERPSSWWRGLLRWSLAGPVGMIAAIAVGIAYAVWVPGAPQTRLVIGGLLVPVLWGGAMAWTLADNRILRATAVLVGVAVAGFGLSILKGFS